MIKICHISTVHRRGDTRIYKKELVSLQNAGFDVSIVTADGIGDANENGIKIYDVGKTKNRFLRTVKSPNVAYKKAKYIDAKIYHIHDPELIPIGFKLKKLGKIVITDIHEDVSMDILSKFWIPKPMRWFFSKFYQILEDRSVKTFDYVITATPTIENKFKKLQNNLVTVNNYPILDEFEIKHDWDNKEARVCHIGTLTDIRGVENNIDCLKRLNVKLDLGGIFPSKSFFEKLKSKKEWEKVDFHGFLNREKMKSLFQKSIAGIVTFLPDPNHFNSQPNKLFEYMSAGIPVIGSNFNLWKEIIEKYNAGICVNPENVDEISNAIIYLNENRGVAKEMGENGKRVVKDIFNWGIEERKLIEIYNKLL